MLNSRSKSGEANVSVVAAAVNWFFSVPSLEEQKTIISVRCTTNGPNLVRLFRSTSVISQKLIIFVAMISLQQSPRQTWSKFSFLFLIPFPYLPRPSRLNQIPSLNYPNPELNNWRQLALPGWVTEITARQKLILGGKSNQVWKR